MAKGAIRKAAAFIVLFITLVIIDSFWIGFLANSFYREQFGSLMLAKLRIIPALLVWLLIALGIRRFILPISSSYGDAAINGAIFGIVLYGVYDLTNYATINGWTLMLVVVDCVWGMVLCSIVSVIAFFLKSKLFKV